MAKATIREIIEVGNYNTGYYRRAERCMEFEGSAQEISYLIATTARVMQLPGDSSRGPLLIESFPKLLQLEDYLKS